MMEPSEYLDSETAKTEFGRILGGKKKKRSKKSAIIEKQGELAEAQAQSGVQSSNMEADISAAILALNLTDEAKKSRGMGPHACDVSGGAMTTSVSWALSALNSNPLTPEASPQANKKNLKKQKDENSRVSDLIKECLKAQNQTPQNLPKKRQRRRMKLFSSFQCSCGNSWSSRHAGYEVSLRNCTLLTIFRQKCKFCSRLSLPFVTDDELINSIEYAIERCLDDTEEDQEPSEEGTKKPHKCHLCEICGFNNPKVPHRCCVKKKKKQTLIRPKS